MAAVLLAGGQGKRMGVLCRHRPKPVLPFAGTYRVMDFALSNCLNSRIGQVAVLTDYQSALLANYLRRWQVSANSSNFRLDVLESRSHYAGTADAVYQNLDRLRDSGADKVLVLAADHIYSMDYRPMLAYHEQTKADVTIGVVSMPREQARQLGAVTVDAGGRVVDFAEKAYLPSTGLVSMGIYIFNLETLNRRLSEDALDACSAHDFGYCILPKAVKGDRVFAYRFDGYWRDIGTIESYHRASIDLACGRSQFSFESTWPVVTARNGLTSPHIAPNGRIHRTIVSPGSYIMGYVENSVIGPGVCIEEHAVVRNSVLMDNVFVGEHSVIQSCIIDEGVSVSRCTEIRASDGFGSGAHGVVVLGKDNSPLHPPVSAERANLLRPDRGRSVCRVAAHRGAG